MSLPRDQLVAWLRHRDPREPIRTVETNTSILAFQGDRVYKLKKPVRFPFIDLSTEARRLKNCEQEVALNQRLAPDIYLGVEPLTADGAVIDHVVVMRRLSDTSRLASLLANGNDVTGCVEALAAQLAQFHAGAPTGGAVDHAATRDAVARLWNRAFEECTPFVGTVLSEKTAGQVVTLVQKYLAGREKLFAERIDAGRARDGHGDLLADDIFCLPDGPRVLDCLEFDERLRYSDVLADVAFLAMDLERLGHREIARHFLDTYRALAREDWRRSLEDFYIAYRAHVRAKIAAIADDEERAQSLLGLALDHLRAGRVRVVLVGGPPATGKSTLARAIADRTGYSLLQSDAIRKARAGLAPTSNARRPLDQGVYSSASTARTYEELTRQARKLVERGTSVVLDATWSDPAWREEASRMARETSSDVIALRCQVPIDVAVGRAMRRSARGLTESDADASLTAQLTERFSAWPEATVLDATLTEEQVLAIAFAAVGPF